MLPSFYSQFIHVSRYARWRDADVRRETWEETVDRYLDFMCEEQCKGKIDAATKSELRSAILELQVMPSMRCMMTAGPALARDNVAGFNCSAVAIDNVAAFDEMMYLLMCGVGVGFSVERQFVNQLPTVPQLRKSKTIIKVEDSRIGWANAFRELLSMLYQGRIPEWDTSEVRPAGTKLKTFGGRASGPAPLEDLFRFCVATFRTAEGRKMSSIECHDICCKIGEVVVMGGVRRSAEISLTNPSDDRMRYAKSGNWYDTAPWRRIANISAAYTEKPGMDVFFREWLALYESKSGERGIFNREAAKAHLVRHGRRDPNHEFLVNPCGEIILRSGEMCNLSEAVVRSDDTPKTLKEKVRLATILGTMQATLTNFRYLRPHWQQNTQDEALLGVSLTGVMDNVLMSGHKGKTELAATLDELRKHTVQVNKQWAKTLGINPAMAITTNKPSGTVSQLVDCASGLHPRYSEYYIRTVRADNKDPVTTLMKEAGFPHEPDVTKPDHTTVFSFPVKSPDGCTTNDDVDAIEQLELWRMYQDHYCEHKPSMTVYVREHQWMEVGAWVYKHFDAVSGVTFLPSSDHCYAQAPYQEVDAKTYEALVAKMPKSVDWAGLARFEKDDASVNTREYACTGDSCEVVDLVK